MKRDKMENNQVNSGHYDDLAGWLEHRPCDTDEANLLVVVELGFWQIKMIVSNWNNNACAKVKKRQNGK